LYQSVSKFVSKVSKFYQRCIKVCIQGIKGVSKFVSKVSKLYQRCIKVCIKGWFKGVSKFVSKFVSKVMRQRLYQNRATPKLLPTLELLLGDRVEIKGERKKAETKDRGKKR